MNLVVLENILFIKATNSTKQFKGNVRNDNVLCP